MTVTYLDINGRYTTIRNVKNIVLLNKNLLKIEYSIRTKIYIERATVSELLVEND